MYKDRQLEITKYVKVKNLFEALLTISQVIPRCDHLLLFVLVLIHSV